MAEHAIFGAGCLLLGLAIAWRYHDVALCLASLVAEATAREISPHSQALARAGIRLIGMANMLLGAAALLSLWRLIIPMAAILIATLVYLLVRLVRLSNVQA